MENYYDNKDFTNLLINSEEYSDIEFECCTFTNCTFEESLLNYASFTECTFTNCNVRNMKFRNCEMHNCEFYSCNLIGINWDDFTNADRSGLVTPIDKIEKCVFKFNTFAGLGFVKFNFAGSQILESNFLSCNLKEAKFNSCNLTGTAFTECDCSKADFRNSYGWNIPLTTNAVKGAKFSFPEVVNLLNGLGISWE